MYPTDFPIEEPAPLLDPTLLLVLVLVVLALAAVSFWLGQVHNGRVSRRLHERACDDIHRFIKTRCDEARRADRNEIFARAARLDDAVQATLGPLLALGGPVVGLAERLHHACEGKPDGHQGRPADHGDGEAHDHDDGHGDVPTGERPGLTIHHADTVLLTRTERQTSRDRAPRKEPPGLNRAAVREAVHAFADHWSRPETRTELKRLQASLTVPNLPKERPGH